MPDPSPYRALTYFTHVLAAGEPWVAERAGATIGVAGRRLRDVVSFLTDLFVDQAAQSRGVRPVIARRHGEPRVSMRMRQSRVCRLKDGFLWDL